METANASRAFERAVFEDALGSRHHAGAPGGHELEIFELRDDYCTDAFEAAVRERFAALAGLQSAWFTRVRGVQRVNQTVSKLFVVSDRVVGARLSTVLAAAQPPLTPLETHATLSVIRQLVGAIALMHEKLPGIAHGAISAERIIITPDAHLVVADYVLGAALQQLGYPSDWYWKELRIPLPPAVAPAFDQRADVMQIGLLALELILGRAIQPDEYPARIDPLTRDAWSASAASERPLPFELRTWVLRTLHLDATQTFASAVDAWADLERVLGASTERTSFAALEAVMAEHGRRLPAAARPITTPPPTNVSEPTVPAPVAADRTPAQQPLEKKAKPAAPAGDAPVTAAAGGTHVFSSASLFADPSADASGNSSEDPNVTKPTLRRRGRWFAAAAILVLVVTGGALFGRRYLVPSAAAEAPGTLVVNTNPAGLQVVVDGQPRGVTPLTVELAPGAHELQLLTAGEPRIIPFTLTSGSTVAQTIEIPKAAPETGQLIVQTEPAGASVTIDDVPRGTTPLTIAELVPGPHTVTLKSELSTITQEVTIDAGITASLVVPMTAPSGVPVSGWIAITAPVELQVYEDGSLLGTSVSDRIMVSAGRHVLELVNEQLDYRVTRPVMVAPGKVAAIRPEWPNGSMALNAQPWAEVWVDGTRVGETPIGGVTVPIGTHEVIFRHPEFGEQTIRATVTATSPARVSVDMRKR